MDRRLLIGVVTLMLGGIMVGKRTEKHRKWVCFATFFGGPADGERTEMGCVGPDPVRAVISAVGSEDIPERVRLHNHWYEMDMMSLYEVSNPDPECIGAHVEYKHIGGAG
jgi:hypothetical protein